MAEDRLMVSVSGVRGNIGTTLTPQIAMTFGQAFATMLGPGAKVALGRDTRPTGAMIKNAVAAGLMSCGADVVDLGVVTTPGVALMTRLLEADGGVIITASHNPHPYNGIKFLQPTGVALTAKMAGELKRIWEAGEFNIQKGLEAGVETVNHRTHPMHVDAVCAAADVTGIAAKRFKVALDSVNGAGCVVTPMLLGKLGCEVAHLNGEPTGLFAHTPEPLAENITDLCDEVRRQKADVGFAQDPDADRLVVIDENGRFIGEEYTLSLCAAFVLSKRKGDVAINLCTSRMTEDLAEAAGVKCFRSPTGEANVVEQMMANDCIFGGEGGGGIIDPRVVPVRDSLVGIAMILQYMAETGKPLSQLADEIPAYVMKKTKFPCPAGAAPAVAAAVKAAFADTSGASFNEDDGLRIAIDKSWVGVRASNTEPIMRIMAEASDENTVDDLMANVRAIAEETIAGL